MVVFLLLGVIWAAVLVPPWLQSRREARPIASIMSFRSQLWSLERATPNYGVDSYLAYDDAYDDVDDDITDDQDPAAEVHAFEASRRSPAAAGARAGGAPGHDAASDTGSGVSVGVAGVPQAAIMRRRAMAYRRRRQVLSTLVVASAASLAQGRTAPSASDDGPSRLCYDASDLAVTTRERPTVTGEPAISSAFARHARAAAAGVVAAGPGGN